MEPASPVSDPEILEPVRYLRELLNLRDLIQSTRIGFENRASSLRLSQSRDAEILAGYIAQFSALEKELEKDLIEAMHEIPISEHLRELQGVGPILAAKVIGYTGSAARFDTASKYWRYCGYAVIDGQRERRQRGQTLHFNPRLKTAVYLIGLSFLRSHSPYRVLYDASRAYYQAERDWTPAHVHAAALRRMVKVFLVHLWKRWRELDGLEARPLYVHEKLAHTTVYPPEDFGWPPLSRDW